MTSILALALLQQGPAFARALYAIFQKDNPTLADWEGVFANYKKPYTDYVGADVLAKAMAQIAAGKGDEKLIP